jgi:SAM-dependent methyltransferase
MECSRAEPSSNLRKYQTSNPLVRFLISRFFERLTKEVGVVAPKTIIDLGCGEGIVAGVILKSFRNVAYFGFDRHPRAIQEAQIRSPDASFCCIDILDLKSDITQADLLLCLEVLEHVKDADHFLAHIAKMDSHWVIISVPWEPFFRMGNFCRGKDLRRWGNHPEHFQFFNPSSLRTILSRHFREVRIESSFPWLFGICRTDKLRTQAA